MIAETNKALIEYEFMNIHTDPNIHTCNHWLLVTLYVCLNGSGLFEYPPSKRLADNSA